MLVFDLDVIGTNLYKFRKAAGLTQAEAAEKADLSDRTYADIERGSVTMRIDSLLKICSALSITPNDILVIDNDPVMAENTIASTLASCSSRQKETVLKLVSVYLNSLK